MSPVQCETVEYGGWPKCQRLTNGSIEIIVTTDVGPRILRCAYAGGPNLFHEAEGDRGKTGGEKWRPYGGHRLWHAPEMKPRTYAPDNVPVEHSWDGNTLTLRPPREETTGMRKEVQVRLHADADRVSLTHRITNDNLWEIETAAWCLTVMAPGGRAILPQEPFVPFPQALLPVRPLVLWSYTNMSDPRYTWGERSIQVRQDSNAKDAEKIGARNTLGWGAYDIQGTVFMKRAAFQPEGTYPDFGCNWEIYTNPAMLELETLSPLTRLAPGSTITHHEEWLLSRINLPAAEVEMMAELEALAKELPIGNP